MSDKPTRRQFLRTGAAAAGLVPSSSLLLSTARKSGRGATGAQPVQPAAPSWARDLIIYEIATKGFTSPNGPETGTFNSLKTKLPYLQDLGINGIWLTGHSLADPHFFYNIWTQYANIEPDKFEPTLGTPEDFKSLIAEAHRRGIRIFLDVHTHGILSFSPLIQRQPHWFRGGSWHMTDYDWNGGHPDLDDWWVKIWTEYVTVYGVDGYRLDYGIYRPDLWARIRQNAARAGHEIVLFEENDVPIPGVTDFHQRDNSFHVGLKGDLNKELTEDVPGLYDRKFGRTGYYRVVIQYADDGSRVEGDTQGQGDLRVHFDGLTADKIARRIDDDHVDGIPDVQLTVENIAKRPIQNVTIKDGSNGEWNLHRGMKGRMLAVEGEPPTLRLYVATLSHGLPVSMLSCHDEGWEGYPADKSPYVAQGSRALMGYSCLFMPMIPIFFGGEEFNATYRPIPWLSPNLWGGGELGKGRWLYGNMLDWEDLKKSAHAEMLDDVKQMIAVRKQEAAILAVPPAHERPKLMAVPSQCAIEVPVPYICWNDRAAIVVAANRSTEKDAQIQLRLPLAEIGLTGRANYRLTNLFPGSETRTFAERDLAALALTVMRDKTAGGGLRVCKIEPAA